MNPVPGPRVARRLVLAAVAVPVTGAVAILAVVENVVDWGLAISIVFVGGGFVYGVHRATRPDPA